MIVMNEITTVKLVSGEEIIGRLAEKSDTSITLSKPVQIVASQKGMGFAPLCISIDDASEFKFQLMHVLFTAPTRTELEEAYIKSTTGIQLAGGLK
jgi:hypothetical protein